MPRRTVLLVASVALLILGVGFGGALLLSSAPQSGDAAIQQQSPHPTTKSTNTPASAGTNGHFIQPILTPGRQETSNAELTPANPEPTATQPLPTSTPTGTDTPTVTPTDTPYPTRPPERTGGPVLQPNNHKGPRWVTLQAGHWRSELFPDELEHLRLSTGAYAAGISEVQITVQIANLAAKRLHSMGYSVGILDATIPPNYTTDLFLSLHADGNRITSIRGFKAIAPWGFRPVSDSFVGILYEEYGKATGLPTDARTSDAMANYYAFNPVKYHHALNPHVPAALIEMGFLTNPLDRHVLTEEQDRVAWGIANAVDHYFHSGAAGATPSPYPSFTPTATPSSTSTATPTDTSTPTATATVTSTPLPPELAALLTQTALVVTPQHPEGTLLPPSHTPRLPTSTRTPSPTATPLLPIVTEDGRWFPPLSPNGRNLPQPGSKAGWVDLGTAVEEVYTDHVARAPHWRPYRWHQYYVPELGRSIWLKGSPVPMRE